MERTSRQLNDIEEQWEFFLNSIEDKYEEEVQKKFSKFIEELKKPKSKSTYKKNSGFICQIVDSKL